jgi:hypothetical protein
MVIMTASSPYGPDDRNVAIRRFFLYPRERYTLGDLVKLWRVPEEAVVAMFSNELDAADMVGRNGRDPLTVEVSAADALRTAEAFHVFRAIDVERALAADFDRARREHWRTISLVVYLPQFIAGRLAEFRFLPEPDTLAARAERLLYEFFEVDRLFSDKTTDE